MSAAHTTRVENDPRVPGLSGRLLYLQERFPVLSETFVISEIERLREWGVDVSVMTTRRPVRMWTPRQSVTAQGEPVSSGLADHFYWLRRAPRRYIAYLATMARSPVADMPFMLLSPGIARAAEVLDSQHVHTHFAFRAASVARGVAALLGRPRSVTTHANDLFVRTRQLRSRLAGAVVLTISRYNQTFLWSLGIASVVNHCGVDSRLLSEPGERAPATDLVFVGRMVTKKGPLVFLQTAQALRDRGLDLEVRMVGDGPLRAEAEAYAVTHGLKVAFLGALTPEQALAEIRGAKVLCLPCCRAEDGDLDGIPVVLMEAMACGTSVVSTDVSGIPELLDAECGWLVPADASDLPASLADAVSAALEADEAATRAVRAAGRIETDFTIDGQARGVLSQVLAAAEEAA